MRDLRIDTYVKFLRAAQAEHNHRPTEDRLLRTVDAEVALVAPNIAVRQAAAMLTDNALNYERDAEYTRLRDRFIDLANAELHAGP